LQSSTHDLIGIPESDTGLAPPSMWDLVGDKQMMSEEAPLQVARCTKIITDEVIVPTADGSGADASAMSSNAPAANAAHADGTAAGKQKYVINVKQIAKFVVDLGEKVAPTDIEEGMRVGVDRSKYSIQIPLPPKIDPTVSLMTVEDKPDVTYDDVGGAKDAMEKLREVLELPLLHPERFVTLGIDPPKGVLLYGPPGTFIVMTLCDVASSCAFYRDSVDRLNSLPLFFHSIRSFINRNRQDLVRPRRGQSHRRLLYSRDRVGTGAKIRGRRRAHGPRTLHHGPFQARVYYLF
jgi:ATP-dependent 26S proteasome regulatory subunit